MTYSAQTILIGALLFRLGMTAIGQDYPPTQPPAQQPSFRTQSNVVLAPALVRGKNGEIVYGLTANNFLIADDGVEQLVHLDEQPEMAPISLVVAIQLGRTAAAELPRIRTVGTMLDPVLSQGRNRCAVVTFDSSVELARNFSSNGALIAADLKSLRAGDQGAAILDAVAYSVALLKQEPRDRQRVLLLVSETRDHGSHVVTFEDTVKAIAESNTLVYTLAFSPTASNLLDDARGKLEQKGTAVDLGELATKLMVMAVQGMRTNTPKAIASMTGGEYELFASKRGFESRMADFANHLHNRYLLSFEPKDPHPGLHAVSVRLREAKDATIVARDRYWAGESESKH